MAPGAALEANHYSTLQSFQVLDNWQRGVENAGYFRSLNAKIKARAEACDRN